MSKGGGGGPSETKVTQTVLPEYAEPYVQDLLTRAGYASSVPYQPYEGQRLAYFTPTEQEAMIRTSQLGLSGTPPELQQAGSIANTIGSGGFTPNISSNASSSYAPSDLRSGYSPTTRNSGYFATQRDVGYNPGSISSTYVPGGYDKESEYVAGQREMGFEPGTLADQEMLQKYSDPYMQMVVDIQKREAARQGDIRNAQTGLQAAGQGSLGGYREGIIRAENERNLMQQMGDIQTQGSQQAFFNAQQAFEADRAARAQQEQFGQSQFSLNEQAKQKMSELMLQGYSTQEAAKQAAQQFGLNAYSLTQQAQQAKEQFMQSQYGLNQSARQAQEQLAQGQYGLSQQALQTSAQLKIQAYQASEQAKQQAAQLGLDAARINQAGEVAYAQVMMQSQQNQLQAAGMLGQFANQQQTMELERLNAAMQAGSMERGLMQQSLDVGYQDYLRQQAYPWEQLGLYANTIYQNPLQPGATTSTYGPTPSPLAQAAGTGISGLGLYNALNSGQP